MGKRKLRKSPSSKKITKRITAGEVILQSLPEIKPARRRLKPSQQLHKVTRERQHNKYKYLHGKKLSKANKKLYTYVKKTKSSISRKYNDDLEIMMKKKGYHYSQRIQARKYSLVGKNVKIKLSSVVERYNRNNTKGLVKGKWIGIKKIRSLERRTVKAARIQSYMDILGISKEKAKEVYKEIEKKTNLSFEFKALIY